MELVAVRQLGRRLDPLPSMKVPLVEPWSTTYQPPTASTPSMSSTDGELQDGEVTTRAPGLGLRCCLPIPLAMGRLSAAGLTLLRRKTHRPRQSLI
jgi:hypothetical protein